jgi:hypothetical protein
MKKSPMPKKMLVWDTKGKCNDVGIGDVSRHNHPFED